jgi:hypothetical protein
VDFTTGTWGGQLQVGDCPKLIAWAQHSNFLSQGSSTIAYEGVRVGVNVGVYVGVSLGAAVG